VLFTADASGNLLALDAENGRVLWHKYPGGYLDSSPMTYELEARQFVLTAVGDVLYAWTLP
jgi:alcohol dehydrogenase (cytochrome c)